MTETERETLLTAREVAELLRISRATFYTLGYFRQRAIRVSKGAPRWRRSDVTLYLAQREGRVA